MQRLVLLPLMIVSTGSPAFGQNSFTSLKFFGLSLHPYGDENAHLMPLNPGRKGYMALNLDGIIGHEIQIASSKYSLKILQALYADCAGQTGGFTHLRVRAIILHKGKHQLTGGLGPTLIFRRNWHRFASYVPSGFFRGNADDLWQYRMLWYGGELEYHYALQENFALSTTLCPGIPEHYEPFLRYKI